MAFSSLSSNILRYQDYIHNIV